LKKWRILVLSGSYGVHAPEALERLRRIGEVVRKIPSKKITVREMIDLIKDADALILGSIGNITHEVLEGVEKLKVIARHGVGVDNVDLEAATNRGVIVTYTPHANAESVAEHTFALMLSLLRRIHEASEAVKCGMWKRRSEFIGVEVKGKTLGIIGLGTIGRRVAEIAKLGFKMKVIAYDPYVPKDIAEKLGVTMVDLSTLLREADIVTIHAALTSETHHMIGESEFKLMKSTAIIINTARGAIIDEEALIKALKEKWIAGAALDVLEEEPPSSENPLLEMSNVIITPHIAAFTKEALRRMDNMMAEDIIRVYNGLKPLRIANPDVLAKLNLKEA